MGCQISDAFNRVQMLTHLNNIFLYIYIYIYISLYNIYIYILDIFNTIDLYKIVQIKYD